MAFGRTSMRRRRRAWTALPCGARRFADRPVRRRLEAILHPHDPQRSRRAVHRPIDRRPTLSWWCRCWSRPVSPQERLTRVAVVDCDEETQVAAPWRAAAWRANRCARIMATQATRAAAPGGRRRRDRQRRRLGGTAGRRSQRLHREYVAARRKRWNTTDRPLLRLSLPVDCFRIPHNECRTGGVITYEYPLNERIRTLLRLEDLFDKVGHFLPRRRRPEHHVVLVTLFEILEVAGRADLKFDLVQELERQRQILLSFRNNPEISEDALSGALYEIEQASAALLAMPGKIGHYLRENEWLMSIKSRAGIPGGVCEFDLPSYHYWLHRDPALRQRRPRRLDERRCCRSATAWRSSCACCAPAAGPSTYRRRAVAFQMMLVGRSATGPPAHHAQASLHPGNQRQQIRAEHPLHRHRTATCGRGKAKRTCTSNWRSAVFDRWCHRACACCAVSDGDEGGHERIGFEALQIFRRWQLGTVPHGIDHAQEAERRITAGAKLVPRKRGNVDEVVGAHIMDPIGYQKPSCTPLNHHRMGMFVPFQRGIAVGLDLEIS